MNNIYSCSSSDRITRLYPTCHLCTSRGNVWVTAVPTNATLLRPDLGQCFFGISSDMPMTCPDCMNTEKWKHIMRPSDCFSEQLSVVPSLFSNPSTTCLQVRRCPKYHIVFIYIVNQCTFSKNMFWCQIEGICVADLTQCYFPGAIAPNDWASCTIDAIANRLPTCRFLMHCEFPNDYHSFLTIQQLLFLSRQC